MTKDEALEMAMEEMENYYAVCSEDEDLLKAINACKEVLKQPAQEPYAWMDKQTFGYCKEDLAGYGKAIALYTHPHQWQGLTVDDLLKFNDDFGVSRECMLAIEQTLKAKNHG